MKTDGKNHIKRSALMVSALGAALSAQASAEYAPAIWNPPGCVKWYTSGYGTHFAVIHDMEGYYLSSISYLNNCNVSASVHYAVNGKQDTSSDAPAGEVTQMVSEAYYAWHVGCWNLWMYGTEHEGFASNPAWYTDAMYNATIALQKHLAAVGDGSPFPMDRNHIIGHNEWQNQAWKNWMAVNYSSVNTSCNTHTDPGPYWDWNRLITGMNAPTYINPPYYFDTGTDGWTAGNSVTATWWTGSGWPGVLVTDQNGPDAYIYSPAENYIGGSDTTINVNVYPQNGTTAQHDMQLFWKTGQENYWDAAKSSPMVGYTAQNSWIRLNLDVNSVKWSGQTLNQWRLDFDQNNQGTRWIVNHVYNQATPKWWFGSDTGGWTLGHSLTGLTWTDCCGWPGIMYADQNGADAYFYSPAINFLGGANDVVRVHVYPQSGNTANHQVKLYWTTASDTIWNEAKSSETVYFTAQNAWADLTIKVGANASWASDFVKQLRLDVDDNTSNSGTRWIIDYITISPQTSQQTVASVSDIIVDNPAATVTGTWTTGTSATDKYGADYRYKSKGTGTSSLQYTPNVVAAGNYQVFEWHSQGANRTTVAPHVITYNGATQTVNVNQQINGGRWNLLGTFNFATGTAGMIKVTDGYTDAGSVVISDAIKLVYVP